MLDTPPAVGTGGELVPAGDQIKQRANFIDTVERPDAVTAEASMDLMFQEKGFSVTFCRS